MDNLIDKIIFYFENAPSFKIKEKDKIFKNKVKNYIKKLKPTKLWAKKGLLNKFTKKGVYPDFIVLLNNKLIACELEKTDPRPIFELYNGIKLLDELWVFTEIPLEKKHLHYKFENDLKIKQKFFGINQKGELVEIKIS